MAVDAGLYLFLLAGLYSLPLWIHDLWAEFGGPSLVTAVDAEEAEVHWRRVAMQAVVCGLMMAAAADAAQLDVPELHLLCVLMR